MSDFSTLKKDEFNKRIDKSEADFKNNRFKSSSELLAKYTKNSSK